MVSEQRQPVHLAVFAKPDRKRVEAHRNLVLVGLDDFLEWVVDQKPGFDFVGPHGYGADPAVLGAEGLAQPVGDLAPVLDHLPGQHAGPHPIQITSRPDAEQDRFRRHGGARR